MNIDTSASSAMVNKVNHASSQVLTQSVGKLNTNGQSFSDVIKSLQTNDKTSVTNPNRAPNSSIRGGVMESAVKALDAHLVNWTSADKQITALSQKIPAEMANLVKLQRMVHSLEFESQLLTKVGEGVTSTLKRLQQFTS